MSKKNTTPGKLFLIPIPIADDALYTLSPQVIEIIHSLQFFIVENARTARRFISSTHPPYAIETLSVSEFGKHASNSPALLLAPIFLGHNMGMMSEAGCPAIADPGSDVVRFAHEHDITVVPLAGPSSILMSLMASGLGGQQFHFHGYLSSKSERLGTDLRRLEELSKGEKATQIFIEAPYRNTQVLETALQTLRPDTLLSVATDLSAPSEWIKTMPISLWKKSIIPSLHKRPTVFCIRAGH